LFSNTRTIILTTHYLDEADLLADKIAVLSNGKLLTYGTSNYIKRNFGEGYVLKFTPMTEDNPDEFEKIKTATYKIINDIAPTAQKNMQQCSPECETYILPFNLQQNFPDLFEKLEALQNKMPFNVREKIILLEKKIILDNYGNE
jgi:ATP-binding cassette subfamily A (ABC1) protein 3